MCTQGPGLLLALYKRLQAKAPEVAASPNVRHALIEGLRMNHHRDRALAELRTMRQEGVRPIYETFAGALARTSAS